MIHRAFAGVVLGLTTLAGCGSPSPSRRETNATTAQPPATVPKDAAPAPPPVLTPEGLGPLRIGMTLAAVTAAWGPDANPEAIGGSDPAQCDQFRPERAPQGVLVMMENGRLTRISLINRNPARTEREVGLGSIAAQVKAAYKGAAVASPHKYRDPPAEYLTFWSRKAVAGDQSTPTDRGIVFEVDGKGVVDLIHAGGPSIQYVEGCL